MKPRPGTNIVLWEVGFMQTCFSDLLRSSQMTWEYTLFIFSINIIIIRR